MKNSPYFDERLELQVSRHWLPHWRQDGTWVFVTWRMYDSLPVEKNRELQEMKERWILEHPKPWDEETSLAYHDAFSDKIDEWLDQGMGSCLLRNPELSQLVATALEYFLNIRYRLAAYVIMPNHVHLLCQPVAPYSLDQIVKSWKGYTARQINRCVRRSGPFWQEDYWDRLIRSRAHFFRCRKYILENPIKAGLADDEYKLKDFDVSVDP